MCGYTFYFSADYMFIGIMPPSGGFSSCSFILNIENGHEGIY